MKKLLAVVVVLLLIGGVAVFVLSQTAGKVIRKGIVTLGPEIAQVNIELESVDISFINGSGTLKGLKIHNPEGYSGEHAFYADHLELGMEPMSVLSDKIVINEIRIIGPDIQFEQKLKSSNLNQILQNVQAYMGSTPAGEESPAAAKKLEIKHFLLQDAKVGVGVGTKPISLTISSIELNNLGSGEEGITTGEAISVLLTQVTQQVIAAVMKNPQVILEGGGNLLKNAGSSGENAMKKLGDLFGGKKEEAEKAAETNQ